MDTEFPRPRVALVGSGALAGSIAYGLASGYRSVPLELVVVGSGIARVRRLCAKASIAAAVAGPGIRFDAAVAGSGTETTDTGSDALTDILTEIRPSGIVLCSSHQSPYEGSRSPSAWTELLAAGGYGLSLPLQAERAIAVGRTAERIGAWFVNASLPDMVNPVLAALGIPVLCGVGNAGTLAAAIQCALGLPDQRRLAVLAHHLHLRRLPDGPDRPDGPDAWLDEEPVERTGERLAGFRDLERPDANELAGLTAAQVVASLATGAELDVSLPGPNGLPGGYPVRLRGGAVSLRLPPAIELDDAISRNRAWCAADGAVVEDGHVRFGSSGASALATAAPRLVDGFAVKDTQRVCFEMLDIRRALREQPTRAGRGGRA